MCPDIFIAKGHFFNLYLSWDSEIAYSRRNSIRKVLTSLSSPSTQLRSLIKEKEIAHSDPSAIS